MLKIIDITIMLGLWDNHKVNEAGVILLCEFSLICSLIEEIPVSGANKLFLQ
jgi:hypothetical protein